MKVNIEEYTDNGEDQKVEVQIDPWDTWSMDHTLAPIILPMLIQLKKTMHGYPSELTEELWNEYLDEMIYAFDSKVNKEEVYMRFDIATERDAMEKEQERISNGFELFGKYYESLWD